MPNRVYKLKLHKTYYDKGFFNLGVAVDNLVRPSSGPATLLVGSTKKPMHVTVNREANLNGTPRIMGGIALRDWIQKHCRELEVVDIEVLSETELWLRTQKSSSQ